MAEYEHLSTQEQIATFRDMVRTDDFYITPTISRDVHSITPHGFTVRTTNPLLRCEDDRTRTNYIWMLTGWIVHHCPVVLVKVTDMNFTNATKFISTLVKEDALDDFKVNDVGQRTNRIIEFHHTITQKLSDKQIPNINKWSKAVVKLPQVIFTEHSVVEFDLNEGTEFISFLGASGEVVKNYESDRVMGEISTKYGQVMFHPNGSR